MKETVISFKITSCQSEELNETDQQLVEMAQKATAGSYAPYSNFRVGAALLLDNGEIVTGNNQENGAYPSGLCAERVTLFYAHAHFPEAAAITLAIAAHDGKDFTLKPTPPCGACRQVMIETIKRSGKPLRILLWGKKETYIIDDARHLLPLLFDLTND